MGPAIKRNHSEDSSDIKDPDRSRNRPALSEKRYAEPIEGPEAKKIIQRNEKRPQESDPEKPYSLMIRVSKLLISSEES